MFFVAVISERDRQSLVAIYRRTVEMDSGIQLQKGKKTQRVEMYIPVTCYLRFRVSHCCTCMCSLATRSLLYFVCS